MVYSEVIALSFNKFLKFINRGFMDLDFNSTVFMFVKVEFECMDTSPDSHTLKEDSLEFGRKKLNKSFMVNIPENCSLE